MLLHRLIAGPEQVPPSFGPGDRPSRPTSRICTMLQDRRSWAVVRIGVRRRRALKLPQLGPTARSPAYFRSSPALPVRPTCSASSCAARGRARRITMTPQPECCTPRCPPHHWLHHSNCYQLGRLGAADRHSSQQSMKPVGCRAASLRRV
jgi:hypothetical protein